MFAFVNLTRTKKEDIKAVVSVHMMSKTTKKTPNANEIFFQNKKPVIDVTSNTTNCNAPITTFPAELVKSQLMLILAYSLVWKQLSVRIEEEPLEAPLSYDRRMESGVQLEPQYTYVLTLFAVLLQIVRK